jgi:Cysteine dioxygenase type I
LAHPAGRGDTHRTLPVEALAAIAAGLAQTSPGTDPVWTPGTRRHYTCLLDTDLYDAWLIEWLPASSLELHDHGGSHGAVVVTNGTLVETYTDLQGYHPLYTRPVTGPQTFTVPATRVHQLSNPGPAKARSVHVYSPPLREMTFYDYRPGNFLTPLSTSQGDLAVLEKAAT